MPAGTWNLAKVTSPSDGTTWGASDIQATDDIRLAQESAYPPFWSRLAYQQCSGSYFMAAKEVQNWEWGTKGTFEGDTPTSNTKIQWIGTTPRVYEAGATMDQAAGAMGVMDARTHRQMVIQSLSRGMSHLKVCVMIDQARSPSWKTPTPANFGMGTVTETLLPLSCFVNLPYEKSHLKASYKTFLKVNAKYQENGNDLSYGDAPLAFLPYDLWTIGANEDEVKSIDYANKKTASTYQTGYFLGGFYCFGVKADPKPGILYQAERGSGGAISTTVDINITGATGTTGYTKIKTAVKNAFPPSAAKVGYETGARWWLMPTDIEITPAATGLRAKVKKLEGIKVYEVIIIDPSSMMLGMWQDTIALSALEPAKSFRHSNYFWTMWNIIRCRDSGVVVVYMTDGEKVDMLPYAKAVGAEGDAANQNSFEGFSQGSKHTLTGNNAVMHKSTDDNNTKNLEGLTSFTIA